MNSNVSQFRPNVPPADLTRYGEDQLKEIAVRALRNSFSIEPEVTGKFLPDGSNLRIDFLMHPKPHLVSAGFVDAPIGLEVKAPGKEPSVKHAMAYAWQCITYSMSEFRGERTAFVLMFLDMAHFWTPDNMVTANLLKSLLVRSNVGDLTLNPYALSEWRMAFAGVRYFSARDGLSNAPNAALKRRVGNSK